MARRLDRRGTGRRQRMRKLFETVIAGFLAHGCVTHGAALAFYALFVLVPIPIFVVSGAATLLGHEPAREEVVEVLRSLTGEQMAVTLSEVLESADELTAGRGVRLFGLASLAFGATAFFVELQEVLNKIWEVPPGEFRWSSFLRSRLVSFVMVVAAGAVLLVLTLGGVVARGLGERLAGVLPLPPAAFGLGGLVLAYLVIAGLLGLLFRYLPEAEVSFRDVWLGSLVTALLVVCGSELVGLYLRHTRLASAYGAAGSLVLSLSWIYYTALAFLFGAELTRCLSSAPLSLGSAASSGRGRDG